MNVNSLTWPWALPRTAKPAAVPAEKGHAGRKRGARLQRERAAESLKKAIESIHESGCVIKDLDIGLLDFPTLFRGEEVYLCWKLGEPKITHWHGLEEGFAGRKPIDDRIANAGKKPT